MKRRQRRGSTFIEFALLMPVVAALTAGFAGVGVTFIRSLQAEDLCRSSVRLASDGADFNQEAVKQKLFAEYGGATLSDGRAALYVRHIMRDAGGYRFERRYSIGNIFHWKELAEPPQSVIQLEPGEDAWVSDIWMATGAIGGLAPDDVHARFVQ